MPTPPLRILASLWTTLAGLLAVAALLLYSRLVDAPVGTAIALPFTLLGLNLLAALALTRALQRQAGLLVFHLALALLAFLAALGNLIGLTGHVEITEGAEFDPRLVEAAAGPLHPWRLDGVRFTQGDFTVDYAPGMKRRQTRSRIAHPDGRGGIERLEVGDDRPLIVDGYRFYTSFNKGFAPIVTFHDASGRAQTGAIHLPSYPLNDFRQGNLWTPPGGSRSVKLWLHLPEVAYAEDGAWQFHKPTEATLVVIDGERRIELPPGDSAALDGGRIRFDELRSWMGYTIFFDPTTPWMIAAAMVGALGLAWHVAGKLRRIPWRAADASASGAGNAA